jgi:hypothetical protein
MPKRPNPARRALWLDRVSRQLSTGLSVEQFCAREQCSRSAFYRWRGQFELADHPESSSTSPTPSTFLPVSVRAIEMVADQPVPIEADLPNGIRLRIPTTNARLACRLIRAVARAKTGSGGSR